MHVGCIVSVLKPLVRLHCMDVPSIFVRRQNGAYRQHGQMDVRADLQERGEKNQFGCIGVRNGFVGK